MTNLKLVDYVKWIATIIQLIGYGMTGLNMTPYNVYLFFLGIFLWIVFYALSKAPLLPKGNPFIKESEQFHY